jgi:photosystem II stability/assembly factor-like uncharacterized protein
VLKGNTTLNVAATALCWCALFLPFLPFLPPSVYHTAQAQTPTTCATVRLTEQNGLFRDRTDDNDEYAPDRDCFWLISPPGARQIRLTFTQFATEEDYDYVTVYDGADTTARILGIFSGLELPPTVVSSGGVMLVRFTTDSFTENLGWAASYFSSTRPVTISITPTSINFPPTLFGNTALDSCLVSGSGLQGNFRIGLPRGFRASLLPQGPFVDTLIVPNRDSVVRALRVYVQFVPPAPGQYAGRVLAWNGTGVTNMAVSGIAPPAIFWEPTNGPFTGRINHLALGAQNTIIAGTFGGVYLSNSSGAAWLQSNDGLRTSTSQTIRAIVPTRTGIFLGTNNGIYRSLNNGRTWQPVNRGLPNRGETNEVYALTGRNDTLFVATQEGIFRSLNNADQWQAITNPNDDGYVSAMILHRSVLYAAVYVERSRRNSQSFIYRSQDLGRTWTMDDSFVTSAYVNGFGEQGNSVFAATNGDYIFRSDNDGDWAHLVSGLTDTGGEFVYAVSASAGMVYAATYDGVFRSANNGESWEQPISSRKSLSEPYANTVLANGVEVFAGTDAGVFRSINRGGTWEAANTGLTAAVVTTMLENRGVVFAGTAGSGVWRSNDNGITWSPANTGLRARFINAFAARGRDVFAVSYDGFNPANPRFIPGVYRSQDNGASWTSVLVDTTIIGVGGVRQRRQFRSLIITPRGIFAGGDYGGIWRSTNNSVSWAGVSMRQDKASITCFAQGLGNSLFAGTNGQGVYRSDDDGRTWIDVSPGDTDDAHVVNALARVGTAIFAATDDGIYRTVTNGRTWLNMDFPDTLLASSLYVAGGVLYAGTYGNAIWRSVNEGFAWEPITEGLAPDTDIYSLVSSGGASGETDLYVGLGGNVIFRSSLQLPTNTSRAFFEIPDTLSARPGELVDIPIVLKDLQQRPQVLPIVTGVLRFNASMLDPLSEELRQEAVVGGERLIPFRFRLGDAVGRRQISFRFRALLGNSVATPLTLTSLSADGVLLIAPKPGIFTLRGLSEAGGTRLFLSERQPILASTSPNPAETTTTVRYELTEIGTAQLMLLNTFGQTVKSFANAGSLPGEYELAIDVSNVPSGVYFLVLQTPKYRKIQQVNIVR